MRIAVVGAGVSGLVAAHLLAPRARDHGLRGRAPTPAATPTRCGSTRRARRTDVDTGFIVFNDRNYPQLRARCSSGSASPAQPSDMSFAVSDERGDFEYAEHVAERPVRQARAPRRRRGSTACSPTSCASSARRARCSRAPATGPSLGDWLEEHALLAPVRRAADRAAGRRGLVGRPAPDVDASRRASWSSSSTTTGCSACATGPQWRTVAGGSRALRRGARRAVARRGCGSRRRSTSIARDDDHVTVTPRGGDGRALRRGRARHALRPGAGAARRRRPTASTSCSARSPTSPTRRCCTPTRALLPRRRRAWASWNYHLLDEPPGKPTVTYHMNRLQALDADREFCVTLNRTEAIDPDEGHPHDRLLAPGLHRRGRGRAGAPRRDQRPRTARTSAAPTGAGASTRTASQRRCAWPSALGAAACDAPARIYEGTIRHRRFADARARVPHRHRAWPTSTSTSCPALLGGRLVARARPGSCASAARDYLGDPRVPLADAVRDAGRASAPARAPDGPDPPADPPAHVRALLQPGQLLLLLRRRTASARGGRRRGDQHAVGRAPRLRRSRATATAVARRRAPTRCCTSRRSWAWTSATTWTRRRRRARRCRCTSRTARDGERAFDATLGAAAPAADAALAAPRDAALPGRDAARARADLRPRGRAEAQGRPRPPAPGASTS